MAQKSKFKLEDGASPAASSPREKFHYEGHRGRLKQRFMEQDGADFSDYELLELLLFRTLKRIDTKPLAKALLKQFGSLNEILNSEAHLLAAVKGCGPAVITDLKLIRKINERICQNKIQPRNIFASWDQVLAYLGSSMAHLPVEQFRIMYLNKRYGLIREVIHQHGTVDETAVYPREIIKKALELSASSLIMIHNHPSGTPEPSLADIKLTSGLIAATRPLGIKILDHIIIARQGYVSFKERNLLC